MSFYRQTNTESSAQSGGFKQPSSALAYNELCRPTTQVFRIPDCRRMGKHRFFAGRPKLGAFPVSIPVTHIYDMAAARGQYRLCESTCDSFRDSFSTSFTAYIVCLVSFIDAWTKRILYRQPAACHVSFSIYLLCAAVG